MVRGDLAEEVSLKMRTEEGGKVSAKPRAGGKMF